MFVVIAVVIFGVKTTFRMSMGALMAISLLYLWEWTPEESHVWKKTNNITIAHASKIKWNRAYKMIRKPMNERRAAKSATELYKIELNRIESNWIDPKTNNTKHIGAVGRETEDGHCITFHTIWVWFWIWLVPFTWNACCVCSASSAYRYKIWLYSHSDSIWIRYGESFFVFHLLSCIFYSSHMHVRTAIGYRINPKKCINRKTDEIGFAFTFSSFHIVDCTLYMF